MPTSYKHNAPSPHPKADNARDNIDASSFARTADINQLNSAARGIAFITNSPWQAGRSAKIERLVAGTFHLAD